MALRPGFGFGAVVLMALDTAAGAGHAAVALPASSPKRGRSLAIEGSFVCVLGNESAAAMPPRTALSEASLRRKFHNIEACGGVSELSTGPCRRTLEVEPGPASFSST